MILVVIGTSQIGFVSFEVRRSSSLICDIIVIDPLNYPVRFRTSGRVITLSVHSWICLFVCQFVCLFVCVRHKNEHFE